MPPKVSSEHTLIFDWGRLKGGGSRLIFAILAVLAGITLFFYLFKVVYPESERFTPVPHQVLALNAADPANRAIMNKVRDVDYLILSQNKEMEDSASLSGMAPVFHPSFEGHQLTLQDLPHRPFVPQPPRLMDSDEPVLPPLDLSELKGESRSVALPKPASSKAARLVMKFEGLPAERLPKSIPDLSEVPVTDPEAYRFKIGVNADGRVSFTLPVSAPDQPAVVALLTERIRRLRFAPVANDEGADKTEALVEPQWGDVLFEWRAGS